MKIEIINVDGPITKQNAKGDAYQFIEVAYKDSTGSVKAKKVMSFTAPEVFKALAKATKGDSFEIKTEKPGQYVNWVGVGAASTSPTEAVVMTGNDNKTAEPYRVVSRVTGSNYPTSEEREWTQTRIGRQACLNTAAAFLAVGRKGTIANDELLAAAAVLEAWVGRRRTPMEEIENMSDDIPE